MIIKFNSNFRFSEPGKYFSTFSIHHAICLEPENFLKIDIFPCKSILKINQN